MVGRDDERDRSNGEQTAGDGRPISLNGAKFAKGLGVHANSGIRYNLDGPCQGFVLEAIRVVVNLRGFAG